MVRGPEVVERIGDDVAQRHEGIALLGGRRTEIIGAPGVPDRER